MATETMVAGPREDMDVAEDALPTNTANEGDGLHLPSLRIQGFRCFEDITIKRLGRVNLIVGENGSGKTSLLEAVRVFVERGRPNALLRLLHSRGEYKEDLEDVNFPFIIYDSDAFFYGRNPNLDSQIVIGTSDGSQEVIISHRTSTDEHGTTSRHVEFAFPLGEVRFLEVRFNDLTGHVPFAKVPTQTGVQMPIDDASFGAVSTVASLGPQVMDDRLLATFWDNVAMTAAADKAIDALKLLNGAQVDDATVVGGRERATQSGPRVLVRVAGGTSGVPLQSLGDGAVRLFGYALALANVSGGFLLIDEIENGIHYTVLPEFWRMIFGAARDYNVQVFATTHSYDCIKAFTQASDEEQDADCALVRIGKTRITKRKRAVEYSREDLQIATRHGIEVR